MNQYDSKNRNRTSSAKGRGQSSSARGSRGSGSAGQAARISAVQKARRNSKKKKRRGFDLTKIAITIVALLIIIICVVLGVKSCKKEAAAVETDVPTTQEETKLHKEVTVDGLSITGLSREAAREKILDSYKWSMKVTYQEEEYEVQNLMGDKVDRLLQEIFTGESKETYMLDTSGMEEDIEKEVKYIADKWDKPAKNGEISGFDKEKGSFIYSGEANGTVIDREKLAADMNTAVSAKKFDAVLAASSKEVSPEITEAQAKEMYQVIGTYTTKTTANKDRNTNIRLAAESMNGLILQPGEEFSFNKTTGERSEAKGYKPAGAYLNGVLVEEPGGGVCQVSSTLYNAVIFSGLTTTERHAHSYEPSYVVPGEDAMVSFGGPDMKFKNKSSTAIAIRTKFVKQDLTISIVGIPVLEKGVKYSMKSEKTAEIDPPAPEYEEDQTLEPDVEKEVTKATKGSRWVTNLVITKDGKVISDEFFHNSSYRGKPAKIKRNTSGVVVKPEESSTAESTAESSTAGTTPPETQPTQPTTANPGSGPGVSPSTEPSTSAAQPGGNAGEPGAANKPAETSAGVIAPNPMSPANEN